MKNFILIVVLFTLFFTSVYQVSAQSLSATQSTEVTFENGGLPQWAKDLRRWDIITFGVFPFSLFVVTFVTDTIRWIDSDADARYAPWPFKPANAVQMSSTEFGRSIIIAAGLSVIIGIIDYIIVVVKRNNERERIEIQGSSTYTIDRFIPGDPQDEPPPEPSDENEDSDEK